MKEEIVYRKITEIHPYRNNPRKNREAVEPVAASIKEYGFRSPIQITETGEIINGHTRWRAAKKLGLQEVPCVVVKGLTPEQIKEYRLIDNKTSEYAAWDKDLLAGELIGMDLSALDFAFDFSGDVKKESHWTERKRLCDLKDHVQIRRANEAYYQSLMKTGKKGIPLTEIKVPENVQMFAETALAFIEGALGGSLRDGDWCIMTTPRRRHLEGFHFATAVCEYMAGELGIPFYRDAVTCKNRDRMNPEFTLQVEPEESNVLLYDDIITTGLTIKAERDLLQNLGHTVFTVISIDNH